jgi:hypothetical protein
VRTGDEDFSFGLMVLRVRCIRCHGGPSGSHVSNPIKSKPPSLGEHLTGKHLKHLDDRSAMQKSWRAHVSEGQNATWLHRPGMTALNPESDMS